MGDEDEAPEGETDEERGRRIARQWIKDGGEDVGGAPADESRILADVDDDAIDPNADANRHEAQMDEEMDDEDSDADDSRIRIRIRIPIRIPIRVRLPRPRAVFPSFSPGRGSAGATQTRRDAFAIATRRGDTRGAIGACRG